MTLKFLQKDKAAAQLKTLNATLQLDNQNLLAKVKELEAQREDAGKTIAAFPLAQKDFEAKVATLTTDITNLKAEHASSTEKLNQTWQEKLDVVNKQLADLQAEKEQLVKDHATETAALKAVKTEEVQKEVAIVVAKKGLEPTELPSKEDFAAELNTPKAKLDYFKSLSGKEKAEYYNANRRDIMHAAKITA